MSLMGRGGYAIIYFVIAAEFQTINAYEIHVVQRVSV